MTHSLVYRCIDGWDRFYRRYHDLVPVGPLLYVGKARHEGDARCFADGTALAPGDWIGTLHFNNAEIARLGSARGRHGIAWQFAQALRASLEALAHHSLSATADSIAVYQGTTWMQSHGLKVGFISEPLPAGWRSRFLKSHFRLLKRCFSPAGYPRASRTIEPRMFWITRLQLQEHFGPAKS